MRNRQVVPNMQIKSDHTVAQGTRFCTEHIFLCKIICNNYFIMIKMYSVNIYFNCLIHFFKNENSVLPILIEKNFQ